VKLADVFVPQLADPSTSLDAFNCTCAAGASGCRWHWNNERPTPDPILVWPPLGGHVRALCREPSGRPDTEGGTNLYQIADAIQQGWGAVGKVWTGALFDDGWDMGREPDVLIIWQFSYAALQGTRYACSRTFRGGHAASSANHNEYACDFADPLADGRYTGCPKGVQRMPRSLLRQGCGELVIDPRTGRRRGAGRANFLVIRAMPPIESPPVDEGDLMFNVAPSATFRDAILKEGTVLYRDAALTVRHSAVQNRTPLGFLGSTTTAHVVVNSGRTNYVRREDVERVVVNERHYE
jgi:hypothetical protein